MTQMLKLSPDLEVPLSIATAKLGIIAESGAGKSYTATVLAEMLFGAGVQIIAIDPIGIWWGLQASADGKRAGLSVLVLGGDHGNMPITPESGELVARMLAETGVSAVIDLSNFVTSEIKRFSRDFAEGFYQAKKKHRSPVHLFLEEGQTFAPQNPESDENVMLNRFERLCKQLRNCGVGWSIITQQPQSVHKRILNLANTLILLRTTGPHERKAIEAWAKSNASGQTDLIGDLPTLDTGTAYVWSPSFLKVAKRVRISEKTTFDAGKTPEVGEEAIEPKRLAAVDIERFRDQMASIVQEAEADDPKALKRTIVELRGQLAKKAPPEKERVEVRAISAAELKRVEKVLEGAQALSTRLLDAGGTLSGLLSEMRTKLQGFAHHGPAAPPGPAAAPQPPMIVLGMKTNPPRPQAVSVLGRSVPISNPPRTQAAGDSGKENYVQLLIRTAVARLPMLPSRNQLAVLSGRSLRSSSFDAAMADITRRGLMVKQGNLLSVTAEGLALVGGSAPTPASGDEIRSTWLRALPSYEAGLLTVLLSAYPQGMSRVDLAAEAGKSSTSSAFDGAVSTLKKNGLVVAEAGAVTASETLFPDRAA